MVGAEFPAREVIRRGVRWRGFARSDVVRVCGVSVAVGGVLMLLAAVFAALLMSGVLHRVGPTGNEMFAGRYRSVRLTNMAFVLPGALAAVFVAAGMLGARQLLPKPRMSVLLVAFGTVALVFAVLSVALTVREFMPRYSMPNSLDITPLQVYQGVAVAGWAVGVTVAGVAAIRIRSLGTWRFALPFLGLAGVPPERLSVFMDFPIGPHLMMDVGTPTALLVESLRAASGVSWVVVGALLTGAKKREYRLRTADSLAVARRFYKGFWVSGDPGAADDFLSQDFVDHRRNVAGSAAFKHVLKDLRATFPDMEFVVLRQTADGEDVTTTWRISGTDTGGLLYFPPTGRKAAFGGVFTDTVREGRISDHRGRVDEAALFGQLGLSRGL